MTISSQEARAYAESIVETAREPFLVLDEELHVVAGSRAFYRQFRLQREETENRLIFELGEHQWDIPELRRLLETVLREVDSVEDFGFIRLKRASSHEGP